MSGEKFRLKFLSDSFGTVDIDEPIGFSDISFDVRQKEKGYGRDIFFNDGESQMEFTHTRNHYLDKLLYYNHFFGFEAKVQLEIEFLSGEIVIMDLDFYSADTDDLEYFRCKCIEVSDVQIVKRRTSVKVDLFSDKDIDGNPIDPVEFQQILLKPKAIRQVSEWSQVPFNNQALVASGATTTKYFYANPCANIIRSEIEDTLSWFEIKSNSNANFFMIEAQNNLDNITVKVEDMNVNFNVLIGGVGDGYCDYKLVLKYGSSLATANTHVFLSAFRNDGQSFSYNSAIDGNFTFNIPTLTRSDKIWLYHQFIVRQSSDIPGGVIQTTANITNMKVTVSANAKAYHSVTSGVRLIDAVRQVVKSISGKDVNAPALDGGTLYNDTFLFNGNLLRGLTDKPFYLSLEDLEKSLSTEINGDFETGADVFFGREDEFYNPAEIWFFDNTQFSEFSKKTNERFAINEFNFKYDKFQSEKENEKDGTVEIIHGQSKMTLFNKMVENKRDISVNWVRDALMIENSRLKSIEVTTNTSTQDDDTLFAIDTILNEVDSIFTETAKLFHEYNQTTEVLYLRSEKEPNFKTLGIAVNDVVKIFSPDPNAGVYYVYEIFENSLGLKTDPGSISISDPWSTLPGVPTVNNNGERLTTFEYTLEIEDYPIRNRTDEEFSNIGGIVGSNDFSNLRFSLKRNIETNYNSYLATSNIFWKETPIKTTYYKNNRDFTGTYNDLTTTEGSDYLPSNPILSPWIYENAIFANVDFEDFITIRNSLKVIRGFVRCIDKTNNVIKLYPKRMSYDNLSKELNIMGEAKFEPTQMTINDTTGVIIINEETTVYQLDYKIENDKLYVYDMNRQLLYNGVFWNMVSINGGFADSITELDELMKLL